MKIALASARFVNGDVAFNLARMEKWMRRAKEAGAELVCFGESFLQGFDGLHWDYPQDKHVAVDCSSPEITRLRELTVQMGIDLLFGFIEREGETLYSACALLGGGEVRHLYRRISVGWKEYDRTDEHYQEGTEVVPFLYKGRSCLVALCGDLWVYPERFRQGEDLLFWPVFVNYTVEDWQENQLKDYAAQAGQVCPNTLLINSLVSEEAFGGCCHFADGQVRSALPMGEEGLLVVEI